MCPLALNSGDRPIAEHLPCFRYYDFGGDVTTDLSHCPVSRPSVVDRRSDWTARSLS